eukprot:TRINITY_DN9022_c3_g1_i1.p2 TRINITY_DN9022_c3_g1~~TRINITY_DN9022_c3_g1_i1.p2  ORF type:complete len:81 (-),score=2.29 TRINITY_DN9022_c3_g1_i1:35-277(-)
MLLTAIKFNRKYIEIHPKTATPYIYPKCIFPCNNKNVPNNKQKTNGPAKSLSCNTSLSSALFDEPVLLNGLQTNIVFFKI